MRIGLAYDLKDSLQTGHGSTDDAFEEYDSIETVEAITSALKVIGHEVVWLSGGREFLTKILHEQVDIVFNIAEGRGDGRSRESQVPGVLEMLDIPHTGSDPQCLAICLDKPLTKKIVAAEGVKTPQWKVITDIEQLHKLSWGGFPFPVFLKPSHEGSSKGIRIKNMVEHIKEAQREIAVLLAQYRQPVMVEEFIAGDEVTVGVVGNSPPKILGIMRVLPKTRQKNFIYSIEVKRDWERLVEYECPPHLESTVVEKIVDASLKIYRVLGCYDCARIDFRVGSDGNPYFLEINPLPGLNPRSSDLPIMVRKMGLDFNELISEILDAALNRYQLCVPVK
jgi:D-alanine-D-alanine ligase